MTGKPRRLDLVRAPDTLRPPDRGQLWYDHQIADQFLGGLPAIVNKLRWIRQHLPQASRIKIGRQAAWYETDIRLWIEQQRAEHRKSA